MTARIWVFLLAVLAFAPPAWADTPFQFSAPGLRAPDDPHVNGVRFSALYGSNRSVRGVDFGMFSFSETGELMGVAAVVGVSRLKGDLFGCSTAAVNLHDGRDRGVNLAWFNRIRTMQNGANIGGLNVVDDYSMVDLGAVNISERSTVQVGAFNMTRRIEGVQLGVLNFADNGFLPFFPLFNFPVN